jgi:SAM-dependent methyltransferase
VPVTRKAWNHNTRYHRALLRDVPNYGRVLDIGCGSGAFAALLAARCTTVVALDADREQADRARRTCADLANVHVVHGDLRTTELGDGTFDLVTALASLHHLPFDVAIGRVQQLLRPGGRLVMLGVWTDDDTAGDRVVNHVAGATNRLYQRLWGPDLMDAPTTMPDLTLREVRTRATALVPPAAVRRFLLWRYRLVWRKPLAA